MEGTFIDYFESCERATKCGYCKSTDTSFAQGVWGYRMMCQDYQTLVDRGFQRSGNYIYRPMMKETCCPQYVIRMDATKFKLSKSQKASLRKFKSYLVEGRKDTEQTSNTAGVNMSLPGVVVPVREASDQAHPVLQKTSLLAEAREVVAEQTTNTTGVNISPPAEVVPVPEASSSVSQGQFSVTSSICTDPQPPTDKRKLKVKKVVRPGVGPDPNKHPCKKAKQLRQERKARKRLLAKQFEDASLTATGSYQDNTRATKLASGEASYPVMSQDLSEYLRFPKDEECVHKFRTQLIPVDPFHPDFATTRDESFVVFQKFQIGVHKESEEDAKQQQFKDFLVDTPLVAEKHTDNNIIYGTFHLQYLLDDKIFAVGVLDILPKGVLCEYLYYDPYYRFIAPGVISALMEISLTQKYYLQDSAMQYYYMGYYVQSCPKMNYKSRYSAAALLCPVTNTYIALEKCIPVLKHSPYSRLAPPEDEDAIENCSQEELHSIPLLTHGGTIIAYGRYKDTMKEVEVDSVMKDYVKLVGKTLAMTMKVHVGATEAPPANNDTESVDT